METVLDLERWTAILKTAVAKGDDLYSGNNYLSKPAHVGEFTVASDGYRCLGVRGQLNIEDNPSFPAAKASEWFRPPDLSLPAVAAADLLPAIGDVWAAKPPSVCPECHGQKWVRCECPRCDDSHDADCVECDGKGLTVERRKVRPVRLGRAIVDSNLLADVFTAIAPREDIRIATGAPTEMVRFYGDGWILVVMPLRYDDEERRNLPDLLANSVKAT